MCNLIALFNDERKAASRVPIRIGVGIASGEMIAGYVGTKARATYTCIGETVNLAARIEAHTKVAGRFILIDRSTRDALGERIATDALGRATFKGIATAVEVFAVS
jgi:adenylate cyclase